MRRLAVVLALLAGCGGEDPAPRPTPTAARSVALTIDLERDPAPPDAGTRGGHRGGYRLRADGGAATFSGSLDPPDAELTVAGPRTRVEQSGGRFTVTVPNLPDGETRVDISAEAPGHLESGAAVTITRSG